MADKILHNHPRMEKALKVPTNHVIIDRDAYEEIVGNQMISKKPKVPSSMVEQLAGYQLLYDTILFRINEAMAIHMDKFSDKTVLPKEYQNPDAFSVSHIPNSIVHTEYLTEAEVREKYPEASKNMVWHKETVQERYGDVMHFKSEPGQKVKDPSKNLKNNDV